MTPALRLLALLLCAFALPADGVPVTRWDGLPAMEARFWQGPLAGSTACPMCRHGYDAGLLVLLPGTAQHDALAAAFRSLESAAAELEDPRFRVFVLTIGAPEAALQARLGSLPPDWHVGQLVDPAKDKLIADLGDKVTARGVAHVFAQRRSLRADPLIGGDLDRGLAEDVAWARRLLAHAYAEPVAPGDPDTPKGLLWAAPRQLGNVLGDADADELRRACIDETPGEVVAHALVRGVSPESGASTGWARTDEHGCLQVSSRPSRVRLELFGWRRAPRSLWLQVGASESVRKADAHANRVTGSEPIVGLPCQGCEAVFAGLPARLSAHARLAGPEEPGERLRIRGRVTDAAGVAQPGVVVYAYQTDAQGHYPKARDPRSPGARHGRLRAWALTDAAGEYAFDSIRPASYPGSTVQQHVHMHVIEPGRCTYYLGDLLFDDDPLLTAQHRERAASARGGSGIATPAREVQGWSVRRDIQLGLYVPGYAACDEAGGQ
ncbi:hypothetical protein [Pseudomarimonas salicorniae]|uniref:Intradiol ring-cleavage dioxygenases domain-containing protein n=1 Tax=Pseudomarimonas salicorniae TaxID=2933270 RepID=A0ABT0GJW4_9GAMM|nr:hypothetical protein [Lysobacter sp. CAU 1642]MCK7594845.1 hypothetical protein [Lysobacter sp. CAU 1642]